MMERDAHVVLMALTPLSMNGEGMFLAGVSHVALEDFKGTKLWVDDMAHVVLTLQDGALRIHIIPVVGMEGGLVDVTNYTVVGYMEDPFLEKYLSWLDAKNSAPFEVGEDVHESGPARSDASDG